VLSRGNRQQTRLTVDAAAGLSPIGAGKLAGAVETLLGVSK
jgi:hypothetical protein